MNIGKGFFVLPPLILARSKKLGAKLGTTLHTKLGAKKGSKAGAKIGITLGVNKGTTLGVIFLWNVRFKDNTRNKKIDPSSLGIYVQHKINMENILST